MANLQIPVTKSKGTVEIDTDNLPDAVYKEALLQGLKVLVNRGMSKITKDTYTTPEELTAAAQAKAEENVIAIKEGNIKFSGGAKVKKASGAVMTEARRVARNLVKDAIKAAGMKVSHVEASEITKAANALIETDPTIIEMAKTNLEAREKVPVAAAIIAGIPISEKLVKASEARKAKDQLSAKQAGKVKPRAKQPEATA